MSRLHAGTASAPEIARWFDADAGPEITIAHETMEGQPGVIVTGLGGRRRVRVIDWGFPRLTREMRGHGESPSRIGMVADLTNPMWEQLVVEPRYRCLIAPILPIPVAILVPAREHGSRWPDSR